MDDLQQHIQENLKDNNFRSVWEESEQQHQISRQLISLRLARGLTQKDLAERVGTSQSVIARIENGEQNITINTLNKLTNALKADLEIKLLAR